MHLQRQLTGKLLWLSDETVLIKVKSLYCVTKEINWEAALAIQGYDPLKKTLETGYSGRISLCKNTLVQGGNRI